MIVSTEHLQNPTPFHDKNSHLTGKGGELTQPDPGHLGISNT